jgi:tetratricopeptide (TPR) repeat protein
MANLDNQLGLFPAAIAAGQQAVQLDPNGGSYAVLARAYKNASRFGEAKAVLADATKRLGGPRLDDTIFLISVYEHDQAEFDRYTKDAEETQLSLRNYHLGQARSMQGKYAEAKKALEAEIDEDRRLNKGEIVDGVLVEMAFEARWFGYPEEARAALARISKSYLDGDDVAYEFAMNGDLAPAKRYIAAHEHDPHAPTDQVVLVMPRLRALVAMHEGKLAEALADLEPSRPYEMAGFATGGGGGLQEYGGDPRERFRGGLPDGAFGTRAGGGGGRGCRSQPRGVPELPHRVEGRRSRPSCA